MLTFFTSRRGMGGLSADYGIDRTATTQAQQAAATIEQLRASLLQKMRTRDLAYQTMLAAGRTYKATGRRLEYDAYNTAKANYDVAVTIVAKADAALAKAIQAQIDAETKARLDAAAAQAKADKAAADAKAKAEYDAAIAQAVADALAAQTAAAAVAAQQQAQQATQPAPSPAPSQPSTPGAGIQITPPASSSGGGASTAPTPPSSAPAPDDSYYDDTVYNALAPQPFWKRPAVIAGAAAGALILGGFAWGAARSRHR